MSEEKRERNSRKKQRREKRERGVVEGRVREGDE